MNDTPDFDDDTPRASPEIQETYEAALGRFLLVFNRIDTLLSECLSRMLVALKRDDLVGRCTRTDFAFKLLLLDLLKSSTKSNVMADVPIDLMKQLARDRNILAHGHFDQNPFDGSYEVVTTRVRVEYSAAQLDDLAIKAKIAWKALRQVQAYFDFDDGHAGP